MPPEKFAEVKSAKEAAAMIAPKTITTSKGDNKLNPALLITSLFMIVGIPAIWLWAVNNKISKSNDMYNARVTARAQGTLIYTGATALPTATNNGFMGQDGSIYLTATLQPTNTARPSVTPSPEPTQAPTREVITVMPENRGQKITTPFQGEMWFMYSHYYPPLLGANCHADNVIDGGCRDTTSSGEKWSEWLYDATVTQGYRGGVAVSFDYPLGIDVIVSYPPGLAGKYLAVDYCPACNTYPGVTFIDFLDSELHFDYWTPVKARFVYP